MLFFGIITIGKDIEHFVALAAVLPKTSMRPQAKGEDLSTYWCLRWIPLGVNAHAQFQRYGAASTAGGCRLSRQVPIARATCLFQRLLPPKNSTV